MRCYFNLVDGSEVILDREGIEVSGPEEARAEALHVIREQRQADPVAAQEWNGWTLTAVDSTGQQLFSMPLDDLPPARPIALTPAFFLWALRLCRILRTCSRTALRSSLFLPDADIAVAPVIRSEPLQGFGKSRCALPHKDGQQETVLTAAERLLQYQLCARPTESGEELTS